jgi:hypothetical protein
VVNPFPESLGTRTVSNPMFEFLLFLPLFLFSVMPVIIEILIHIELNTVVTGCDGFQVPSKVLKIRCLLHIVELDNNINSDRNC